MIVGHGRLGLRSALRTMAELEQMSGRRTHAWTEIEAWRTLSSTWTSLGGGVYRQSWAHTFRGRKLDASSCYSQSETLTRTVTEAACTATAGTYFLDYGSSRLYVHLTGGINPATLTMFATTTHYVWNGTKGAPWLGIHPILGRSILTDGGLNTWTSPSNLTNWGETLTGSGHSLGQGASLTEGQYSAILGSSGIGGGSITIDQAIGLGAVGQAWRLSAVYKAFKSGPTAATGIFSVNVGTADGIASDGRNTQAGTAGLAITQHLSQTRRVLFDFVAHEVSSTLRFALTTSAPIVTSVQIDDVRLQPIFGLAYGSPRLGEHTSWEESLNDVYPGSRTTGIGTVELVNGGGYFEDMFSPATSDGWHFDGRTVRVKCGGQFLNDGQEIVYEDMLDAFSGKVAKVRTGDIRAGLDLEEEQSATETLLPIDTYTAANEPNASPSVWSRAKAMLYGSKANITPARRTYDTTTLFGEYEYVACDRWSTGVGGLTAVRAYLDASAADAKDATRSVTLTAAKDYTDTPATGRFALLWDVRVIEITAENNIIDFDSGGGVMRAVIAPGFYVIGYGGATVADRRGLLEAVRAAMVASGGAATIAATYDTTTHKVGLAKGAAGLFTMFWQTGLNTHVSIGPTLGYRGDADDIGAGVTSVGDDALFVDADTSELLRCDAAGYKDDTSGTYTGTASAAIVKGCDIMRHIWRVFLGQPEVNTASFVAMRSDTYGTVSLSAYLGTLTAINGGQSGQVSADTCFATIANSNQAQYQFDGAGTLHYNPRVAAAPSSAPIIPETHYLTFDGYFDQTETYGTIRVNHSQDPTTGLVQGTEFTRTATVKGNRRSQVRSVDTYLATDAAAQAVLTFYRAQARSPLRHMRVTVKGRAMRLKLGDMIKLNRSAGLRGVGEATLVGSEFRIKAKRTFTDHTCELLMHTAVLI